MAEERTYSSEIAATEAARLRNMTAAPGEVYIVGMRSDGTGKETWYVILEPPKCPVRGVSLSSIQVQPWRAEFLKMFDRLEGPKALMSGCVFVFAVLIVIAMLSGMLGFTNLAGSCVTVCVLIAVAFVVLRIYVTETRTKIRGQHLFFDCECGKRIGTDVDWTCGQCGNKHEKPSGAVDSFLNTCHRCEGSPPAFLCYHCGRIIPLIKRGDFRHPAFATNSSEADALMGGSADRWRKEVEIQIEKMVGEKSKFSAITQKVCELRDAEIARIEADKAMDPNTKRTLTEFERQWANKKLQDLKMRVVNPGD